MFQIVDLQTVDGETVSINPRHVVKVRPLAGLQVTQTSLSLADGSVEHLIDTPTEVKRRLRAGA